MNKKVIIIEDEKPASDRLIKLIAEIDPGLQIVECLDSIEDSVSYLKANPSPDLLFMDIQLADGLSFKILEQVQIEAPVIFTTAFDQYALRAFQVNSIDYLLKPVNPEELKRAIEKFKKWGGKAYASLHDYKALADLIKGGEKKYKERFLIRKGSKLQHIPSSSIAYFFSDASTTFLVDENNERYLIDYNLESLEELLDPNQFFRVNRKLICGIKAVLFVEQYFNGRLLLGLNPGFDEEVFISRQRVKDFREWLDS